MYQIVGADGQILWKAQPGPQTYLFEVSRVAQEILYGGSRGGGKLSPLDSLVCTPKGFVEMGSLKVGDAVTNPVTGGSSKVLAIYPQGQKDIWRLTFDDGASLEVGDEHLWAYRLANYHRPGSKESLQRSYCDKTLGCSYPSSRWDGYKVGKTSELRAAFEAGKGVRIPLSEPVLFTKNGRASAGSVDPYIAGVMLGDGCCGSLRITACDDDVRDHLVAAGFTPEAELHTDGKPKTWAPRGRFRKSVDSWLRNHGLRKAHSWEKFVPDYIFTESAEYRLAFLQGLMDTDGTIDKRGRVYFISTSERLSLGVQYLARSLGGKARIRPRQTQFTYLGEKKNGRPSYQVRIWLPRQSVLFRSKRKSVRATDSWNGGCEITRELVKVEFLGKKESQCIRVSNMYGLYVANDFVVTHNTASLIAWMAEPVWNPQYQGLVLRKTAKALDEWCREAWELYRPMGARQIGRSGGFEWPNGARIVTGHFQDERSLESYKGHQYQRIGLEEATQIADEGMYIQLLGSNRSVLEGVPAQVLLTSNPDGPGNGWIKRRFIKVYKDGVLVQPRTPFRPEGSNRVRVFVPARLWDNAILMERDPGYLDFLQNIPNQALREAWLDGNWDMTESGFYPEFRPKGPMAGDPAEANHVIPSQPLPPWCHRWAGMDWGFAHHSATYWGAFGADRRIHVYREMVVKGMGSEELGAEFARRSMPDLDENPSLTLTLYLSHDAFSARDAAKTIAEQIQSGVDRILGPGSCFLLGLTEEERKQEYAQGREMLADRFRELAGKSRVVIKRANSDRKGGASLLREYLRFRNVVSRVEPDMVFAESLLALPMGMDKYRQYLSRFDKQQDLAPLPRLQFHDCCKVIQKVIPMLRADPGDLEDVLKFHAPTDGYGDDAFDALKYLLMGTKEQEGEIPFGEYMSRAMKKMLGQSDDINLRIQVAMQAAHSWNQRKTVMQPISLGRESISSRVQ